MSTKMDNAIKAAMGAYRDVINEHKDDKVSLLPTTLNPEAFRQAVGAYLLSMMGQGATIPPQLQPAAMRETPRDHFMALAGGDNYGYTLTPGTVNGVAAELICFRPDHNSTILVPLFASVNKYQTVHDTQQRRFDIPVE